jgi:methyl-accepting chemotaxis protein
VADKAEALQFAVYLLANPQLYGATPPEVLVTYPGADVNDPPVAVDLTNALSGALEYALSALQEQIDDIMLDVSPSFDTLKEIGDAITTINTTITNLGGTYATDTELSTAVTNLTTAYTTAISTAIAGLKGTATADGDTLGKLEALITSLTGVVNTIKAGASTDYDTLEKIGDAIVSINDTIAALGDTYATDEELGTAVDELTSAYGLAIGDAVEALIGTANESGGEEPAQNANPVLPHTKSLS